MHSVPILAFFALTLQAAPPDARDIVTKALDKDERNNQLRQDYMYLQTQTEKELDAANQTKSTSSKQFEVRYIYGAQYKKLVQKDGAALPTKEQLLENQKLDKFASKHARMTPAEQARVVKDEEDKRRKGREFIKEVPNAFDFALAGEQTIDGKSAWVIHAEPKAGYKPLNFQSKMLQHLRGKMWIEKSSFQIMKIDMEVLDTISIGLFLARLSPGTRVSAELTHINNELWAPKVVRADFDARLALLRHVRRSDVIEFSNYRKFSSETKIVSATEAR